MSAPTTEEVRAAYVSAWEAHTADDESTASAEFDRWLDQVRADVLDATATAIQDGLGCADAIVYNPYRRSL